MLRDTRNDSADPTSGEYLSANGEVAGLAIGSEAGFVKLYFTAQTFRLRDADAVGSLFAGSARLGLGFPREAVRKDEQGRNEVGADGRAIIEPVDDLPASERFFAGGDTTVRGFALDRLGAADTIKDGSPLGGSAVVIFNGELRVSVPGNAQIVGFVDSGNVFKHVGDFDLGEIRAAVGFGGATGRRSARSASMSASRSTASPARARWRFTSASGRRSENVIRCSTAECGMPG